MIETPLPRLKPELGQLTVECPKCHQHVSETCCAYQDLDYYKDCYCYVTRPQSVTPGQTTTQATNEEAP